MHKAFVKSRRERRVPCRIGARGVRVGEPMNFKKCSLPQQSCSHFAFWSSLGAVPTLAQVSGATLSGVVTDTSGAAVPNANVAIKNVATGVVRSVTSNQDGFYTAPNLLPSSYEVTASGRGLNTIVEKGITLTVGQEQELNISLKVGQSLGASKSRQRRRGGKPRIGGQRDRELRDR